MGTRGGIWGLSSLEEKTLCWCPSWVCGVWGQEVELWDGELDRAALPLGTLSLLMHSCWSSWKISADWEKEEDRAWLCLLGRKRLSSRPDLSVPLETRASLSTFCVEIRASAGLWASLCSSSGCCSELLMELTFVEKQDLRLQYILLRIWFSVSNVGMCTP